MSKLLKPFGVLWGPSIFCFKPNSSFGQLELEWQLQLHMGGHTMESRHFSSGRTGSAGVQVTSGGHKRAGWWEWTGTLASLVWSNNWPGVQGQKWIK